MSWNEKMVENRMKKLMHLNLKPFSNENIINQIMNSKELEKQGNWKNFWHSFKKQQHLLSWGTYVATKDNKEF